MSEIDVSKCRRYMSIDGCCLASYEENEFGGSWEFCKDRPNCHYRQLQQANGNQMKLLAKVDTLEKEKEFWCNKSVRFEEFVDKLVEEKDKLKAENDELKNKLKIQKNKQIVVECGKRSFKNILHKYTLSQQCIDEIEEICKVNPINTCWTALNQCDNCEEKEECGIQSPFVKLDIIRNIIKQAKEGE